MKAFDKTLADQVEKTAAWRETEGAPSDPHLLRFSYGFRITGTVGESTFSRRFALLDLKQDEKPDFGIGTEKYIDLMVDELRTQLLDAVETLSLGDPWTSTPADANAIQEDSAVDADIADVPVASTSGSRKK